MSGTSSRRLSSQDPGHSFASRTPRAPAQKSQEGGFVRDDGADERDLLLFGGVLELPVVGDPLPVVAEVVFGRLVGIPVGGGSGGEVLALALAQVRAIG